MSSSIVFIDSRVTGYESLLAELPAGAVYYVLNADQDGLAQIASRLAGVGDLASIHIVSHGRPGALLLGASFVDAATLATGAESLAQIGASLAESGDILLYGCDVSQGTEGLAFIDLLARLSGADIAASLDPTGATAQQGDWVLETQTGAIEATPLQSTAYSHLLAAPGGTVTIAGTLTQGQTLTASNTLTDADGIGTISYQWKTSFDGSTWNNAGTGSTLALTEPMVGAYMLVVASYTDGSGTAESVASDATTATVDNLDDDPTGSVTISGTATQGQTLTASNTVADADGLGIITYQWQQQYDGTNFADIIGETSSTLTLTQSLVGKVLRVAANYTDGHGSNESVPSSATTAVVNVDDDPTGTVSITGSVMVDQTLTASVSSNFDDADGLGTITYTWQSSSNGTTWSALSTGSTLGLSAAQLGKYVRVVASYTDNQGSSESVASSATTAVTNTNNLPTGSVTVSGTVTQGQTLTASNTLADTDGLGTITYTWQSSSDSGSTWTTLGTGSTLALAEAQVGKSVRAVASYTDGLGTSESSASTATSAVANVNDALSGSVTISGTAMQGQTLTASNTLADADGLGTISYQWQYSSDGSTWTNLSTGSTVTLAAAQIGKYIRVTASYTDGHSTSESANSSSTTAVLSPNTSPTGSVTISGTVTQGQTLTVTNTLADVDGLGTISYTWQGSGDSGSTWSTLGTGRYVTLTESEVGDIVRVVASYTDGQGVAETANSSSTAAVANVNDALSGSVTISGTATQGQTLTASNTLADADGLGTLTYTWQSSSDALTWSTVSTGTTLGISEAQIGKYIRVTASYTDGHGTSESASSSATSKVTNVNTAPTGSVTISGTVTQGQTLTASNTLADYDVLGTISYQWQSSSNGGTTWTNLGTAATQVLAEAQVGKTIRVVASYTDGYGTAESVPSTATSAVVNVNDSPTGSVAVSGSASVNQTLTAVSTLADADGLGTLSYTWQASSDSGVTWSALSTGGTLGLSSAQLGKLIRVVAAYTDGHGTAETATSSATSAVSSNAAPTGSVTISGTVAYAQTVSVSNTLADADGLGSIAYTWQVSDDGSSWTDVGTNTQLTLSADMVGKYLRALASYTDGFGTAESVASSTTPTVTPSVAPVKSGTYVGTSGDDIVVSGGAGDKISTKDGNDTINAGDGKNKITAGAGNDKIVCGSGRDTIDGGSGDDSIYGGAGKDTITPGLGSDTIVFDNLASGGADTLSHFNATQDKFAFQSNVFASLAGGITSGNIVIESKARAHDDNDFLLFDTKTKKLYYDADGVGSDEKAILLATVKVIIGTVATDDFALL